MAENEDRLHLQNQTEDEQEEDGFIMIKMNKLSNAKQIEPRRDAFKVMKTGGKSVTNLHSMKLDELLGGDKENHEG